MKGKNLATLLLGILASSAAFAQTDTATVRVAVDTLDTDDKYMKIVLYEDHTWDYEELGRPVIDDSSIYDESWNNGEIHAYKYTVELKDLPDSVDLCLADESHGACCPIRGVVTSQYKWRGRRAHKGTDIRLAVGDTVRAAFDGVVRAVEGPAKAGGYGNLIVIRHPNGLETYYGHLSKFCVDSGEVVKAGECIALGGNTGRSTGPHLHFETRYMGQNFDPERVFDFATGRLRKPEMTVYKHYFSIYSHYGQTDKESKAASAAQFYKVKKGDTLSKIAKKYGTSVSAICKLNKISSKAPIRIGQRLRVR